MDWILAILGGILMVVGIIGAIVPVLPGPPISYLGLLLLHWTGWAEFSTQFLVIMAAVAAAVTAVDYVVPVWGTKKFGGSKAGVRGSTIGLIIGVFFFPPIGIIVGPFLGAVIAELMVNADDFNKALRSGLGSLVGFLMGTGLKLSASLLMTVYFVRALI